MVLDHKLLSVVVFSGIPFKHKICMTGMIVHIFTNIPCGGCNFYIINLSLKGLYFIIDCIIDTGY